MQFAYTKKNDFISLETCNVVKKSKLPTVLSRWKTKRIFLAILIYWHIFTENAQNLMIYVNCLMTFQPSDLINSVWQKQGQKTVFWSSRDFSTHLNVYDNSMYSLKNAPFESSERKRSQIQFNRFLVFCLWYVESLS